MKPKLFRWPEIASAGGQQSLAPLWNRLLWMAGIWTASVAVLLCVAMLLRWILKT